MITEIFILILTFVIAYFVYTHYSIHNYFKKRDLKFLSGLPVLGNNLKSTFLRRHLVGDLDEVYKSFPGERYVGYIEATAPIFLIRDPELIKKITVKDFDHFTDHKQFFSEETDPLFGGSLIMMKGDRWRDMRTTLSPAFTGSKMRHMMPFMTDISANLVTYLKENLTPEKDLDVSDLVRRYTNDVIASAGFGLQVNSLKDRDNEFYKMGQKFASFGFWQRLAFLLIAMFPKLAKFMKIRVFSEQTTNFFRNLVKSTMEFRERNNVKRSDMIQLLMEASKGNLKYTDERDTSTVGFATAQEELKPQGKIRDWTWDELAGQVAIFFAAGFDTTATAAVMGIHELALNQDCQEKLYQEIKNFKQSIGVLSYDNVNDLKYLDCVLSETMRKWAVALIMDRTCTKPYELPPPREGAKPVKLKVGDVVYNMVNTIHMDPAYFPEPDKFDPERFSDENRQNIKPFTYMPFGMGPRNCIGSRFALLELKILLFDLVSNFKILKGPKTADPMKLEASGDFSIRAVGGTFVRLQPRYEVTK